MTSNRLASSGFSENKGLVGVCSWSVSRAHKSWSWSLLLMDFHLSRAKITPTLILCSGVVNDLNCAHKEGWYSCPTGVQLFSGYHFITFTSILGTVEPLYIERPIKWLTKYARYNEISLYRGSFSHISLLLRRTILFVYTEDFVICRFVTYRNSTRHKMKYDREICMRALLPYTNYQISVLNLFWLYTHKKEKIKSFSNRQKAEANVSVIVNLFVMAHPISISW